MSPTSSTTLRRWEHGDDIPTLDAIERMSRLFDCDIGYLLADYDERHHVTADICRVTGLSERAVERLVAVKAAPIGGVAKDTEGKMYVTSARRTINALLESERLDRLLYQVGQFLTFAGSTAEPVEQDADFSTEDDAYRRTVDYVRSQGSEIVKRSKIAEMFLLTAADTFKEIFREIAEEQTGGKHNAKKK